VLRNGRKSTLYSSLRILVDKNSHFSTITKNEIPHTVRELEYNTQLRRDQSAILRRASKPWRVRFCQQNFQHRGIFLQSRVYRINLHRVNARWEKFPTLRAQRSRGVAKRLCASISYSRLLAVNLHTTKESKVLAEGLGKSRCKPGCCILSSALCLRWRTHLADVYLFMKAVNS